MTKKQERRGWRNLWKKRKSSQSSCSDDDKNSASNNNNNYSNCNSNQRDSISSSSSESYQENHEAMLTCPICYTPKSPSEFPILSCCEHRTCAACLK